MKVYDESTLVEISDPDLSAGYVYDGLFVTGYTEERYEVIEKTVTDTRPDGLRQLVPAEPITEPCKYYHKYTEEELAEQAKPDGVEERLTALEDELSATKILLGVE